MANSVHPALGFGSQAQATFLPLKHGRRFWPILRLWIQLVPCTFSALNWTTIEKEAFRRAIPHAGTVACDGATPRTIKEFCTAEASFNLMPLNPLTGY